MISSYCLASQVSKRYIIIVGVIMKESLATITAKGQVTIPAEIRRALGLKPRDKIAFILNQGEVKLEPSSSMLRAGFGAVKPRKKPEDFKELRGEIQKWVARKAEEEL